MRHPRIRLWPPLSPAVYAAHRAAELPFPLGRDTCRIFDRGRHALWHGLRALRLKAGDEVIAPAYHCGSEIEVLVRAGLGCRFYEAQESLEPDEDELEGLLTPRTRALLLIHYYGFPQRAARWQAWCREHGLFLVEDCAQAWLASIDGRPLGSFGDIAVFSLYKTFALPDGGALVVGSGKPGPPAAREGRAGVVAAAKKHVRWLMSRSASVDRGLSRFERDRLDDLALGDPDSAPSAATRFLLPRLADPGAAERRRENYRYLLAGDSDLVPPAFAAVPDGACPLVFPVDVAGRPKLRERLERAGIEARPFWPILHPHLPVREFPGAVAWHGRFVAVPVHHELSSGELERVATALRD